MKGVRWNLRNGLFSGRLHWGRSHDFSLAREILVVTRLRDKEARGCQQSQLSMLMVLALGCIIGNRRCRLCRWWKGGSHTSYSDDRRDKNDNIYSIYNSRTRSNVESKTRFVMLHSVMDRRPATSNSLLHSDIATINRIRLSRLITAHNHDYISTP